MNIKAYFDLQDIYFNELMGDIWLGVLIGVFVITLVCTQKKIPLPVTIMLNIIWLSTVFAAYTGLTLIWVLVVLGVGILSFFLISKAIRRG